MRNGHKVQYTNDIDFLIKKKVTIPTEDNYMVFFIPGDLCAYSVYSKTIPNIIELKLYMEFAF